MSTTVPAGLAALQNADAAIATAISSAVSELATLAGQIANPSEDTNVAAIAADLQTKATALNAAVQAAMNPSSSSSSTPANEAPAAS